MNNKQMNMTKGEIENDKFRRCRQTQCGFFLKGGCKECRECKAGPFIIRKSCTCCNNCENRPGYLRFGSENTEEELKEAEKIMDDGVILIYSNKPSPEHRRQEEELIR